MKKRIGKILLILPIGLLSLLIVGTMVKKVRVEAATEKIRIFPDFVVKDINGNMFYSAQIASGPLLITFFHPECDHCRYEISSLCTSGLLDNHLRILLVSSADSQVITTFMQEIEIPVEANLHFITDSNFKLANMFSAEIIPSNYIYNDSLQLVKVFKGATKPETLLRYLNGND